MKETKENMKAFRIHPFDILETPGHTHPRLYSVEGIHLGGEGQESVVGLVAMDRSVPDAHGEIIPIMFVPVVIIEAGLSSGLFTISSLEEKTGPLTP